MKFWISALALTACGVAHALGAPAPQKAQTIMQQSVSKMDCSIVLSGVVVDSGEPLPKTISRISEIGHSIVWQDATKTFTLSSIEAYVAGQSTPSLSLMEDAIVIPSQMSESYQQYLDDGTGDTARTVTDTVYKRTTQNSSKYTLTPTSGGNSKRPPLTIMTSKLANGTTVVITKTDDPTPTDGITQLNSRVTTCKYSSAKLSDLKFTGFFVNLRKPIDDFNSQHEKVLAADRALQACLASGQPATCANLKTAFAVADSARETLWKNFVAPSDLQISGPNALTDAGSDDGDDSGGGGGQGYGSTSPYSPGTSCTTTGGGLSCSNGTSCSSNGGGMNCSDGSSWTSSGGGMNSSDGTSCTTNGGGMNCSNGTSCSFNGGGMNCS